MRDRERLIRDEAYLIWVEKGRPEGGGSEEHWYEAERRVDAASAGFGEKTGAAAPKRGEAVRVIAKNAGNAAVAAPRSEAAKTPAPVAPKAKTAPLKGEAVDVAPAKRSARPAAPPPRS